MFLVGADAPKMEDVVVVDERVGHGEAGHRSEYSQPKAGPVAFELVNAFTRAGGLRSSGGLWVARCLRGRFRGLRGGRRPGSRRLGLGGARLHGGRGRGLRLGAFDGQDADALLLRVACSKRTWPSVVAKTV